MISSVSLLEGPWLLALSDPNIYPHLLVFNTTLPQQEDSRSWRVLQLPQPSYGSYYSFPARYGDPLAERPEFSVDPVQQTFVVFSLELALVIPVKSFIEQMWSARANPYLGWEDWGENVIAIHPHPNTRCLQLIDTKLLALINSPEGWGVEVYDLSKSGQRDILIQRVGEGQCTGYRKLLSTPKYFTRCQLEGPPNSTYFVGNKLVCFCVSLPYVQNQAFHNQPHLHRVGSLVLATITF